MLRITVEVIPFGDEAEARKIGEMVIANTGNTLAGVATYQAVYKTEGWSPVKVQEIVHTRSEGFWPLILNTLQTVPITEEAGEFKLRSLEQRLLM